MIFGETEIIAKAWLVREICDLVLHPDMSVEKIFLIGSYASGKQTHFSDLDFLVQLKFANPVPKGAIPKWSKIREVHGKLDSPRIHVVFGTERAARSLHEKHKHEKKDYSFREIKLKGGYLYASTHTPNIPSA